jgi:tetratricopeptide (TPR) repeat protein
MCASMTEACCLAAVALTPVLYNPHGWFDFEPIKTAVTRILGTLMLGVLTLGGFDFWQERRRAKTDVRTVAPLNSFLKVCFLALAVYAIATLFSIDPIFSFWGSPETTQGMLTILCNLALCAGAAAYLRTSVQIERVITAALAGSLPVAIYGLFQSAGVDPLFGKPYPTASSFVGYPTFFAGYFLILIPLCGWKVWCSISKGSTGPGHWKGAFFYGSVLLLQVAAFVGAEKRGPFVALIAIGITAVFMLAAWSGRLRLASWGAIAGAVVGLALICMALAAKAGVRFESVPVLGMLAKIVPAGEGTADHYRPIMWAKAPEIVTAAKPLNFPDGTEDRWRLLRPIVGFGPETLQGIIGQHWPFSGFGPGLGNNEHRFHDLFWDTWQSVGLIGLGAVLWLYAAVFAHGYARLGLIPQKRGLVRLAAIAVGFGLLIGLVMSGIYGAGFLGLGFQFGFGGGLVLYPLWLAARRSSASISRRDERTDTLIIVMLAALIGHWVDLAFVFPTSCTSTLFWIVAGCIVGLSLGPRQANLEWPSTKAKASANRGSSKEPAGRRAPVVLIGLLCGGILVGLVHGIVNCLTFDPISLGDVLRASITQSKSSRSSGSFLSLFLIGSWIAISFSLMWGMPNGGRKLSLKSWLYSSSVSLALPVGYGLLKAGWIAALGPLPSDPSTALGTITQFVSGIEILGIAFLGIVVLWVFGMAVCLLFGAENSCFQLPKKHVWGLTGGAVAWGIIAIWLAPAGTVRGEACSRWGSILEHSGLKEAAIKVYEKGLSIDPTRIADRINCAKLIMESAEQKQTESEYNIEMERATALLMQGRVVSDLNIGNLDLGHFYLRWAMRTTDGDSKKSLALRGREALGRAVIFAPETEAAWFDASLIDRELGETKAASKKEAQADRIMEKIYPGTGGDLYATKSFSTRDRRLKEAYARRALAFYSKAVKGAILVAGKSRMGLETYRCLVAQGTFHRNLGEHEAALSCFLRATEAEPEVDTWQSQAMLAHTYADLGNRAAALSHVDKALAGAPAEAKLALVNLKRALIQPSR